MGIDWEGILGAEGESLVSAYDRNVALADKWFEKAYEESERMRAEEYGLDEVPVAGTNPAIHYRGDYCIGTWQGKKVEFKKTFSNHTFTDEECAKLLADEVIVFTATAKDGREYTAKGKLQNLEYNGHKYFGFGFV